MNDLSFETQSPYTPPLGDSADFTFQVFINFSFENLSAANPPENGILDFSFGEVILEDESASSSAQELFVQYGQASSTVLEDPILDIQYTTATLFSISAGLATSTTVEEVVQSSSITGVSKFYGEAGSNYLISQVASSSLGTLYSITTFESCSSKIDVTYITNKDISYRYIENPTIVKGAVNVAPTTARGIVQQESSHKNSRFKANYLPYGNVYERPLDPPQQYESFFLDIPIPGEGGGAAGDTCFLANPTEGQDIVFIKQIAMVDFTKEHVGYCDWDNYTVQTCENSAYYFVPDFGEDPVWGKGQIVNEFTFRTYSLITGALQSSVTQIISIPRSQAASISSVWYHRFFLRNKPSFAGVFSSSTNFVTYAATTAGNIELRPFIPFPGGFYPPADTIIMRTAVTEINNRIIMDGRAASSVALLGGPFAQSVSVPSGVGQSTAYVQDPVTGRNFTLDIAVFGDGSRFKITEWGHDPGSELWTYVDMGVKMNGSGLAGTGALTIGPYHAYIYNNKIAIETLWGSSRTIRAGTIRANDVVFEKTLFVTANKSAGGLYGIGKGYAMTYTGEVFKVDNTFDGDLYCYYVSGNELIRSYTSATEPTPTLEAIGYFNHSDITLLSVSYSPSNNFLSLNFRALAVKNTIYTPYA
jgi:hypothetical protein